MVSNRLNQIQKIRESLRNNQISVGSWMQIPNSSIAEIMGQADYDWVAVDLEHGAFSLHQLPDIFRALELGGTLPLARISSGCSKECKQVLDAGAGGVIIPMIESAQQLRALREACCWPPSGTRGVGFSRANLFGKNFDTYIEEAQSPLFVAMIENVRAIEELQEILSVEGLDAIMVGPYDLSASMGLTAQFENPEVKMALNTILQSASAAGIACGIHVVAASEEELKARIKVGFRFLAYSVDVVFLNAIIQNPIINSEVRGLVINDKSSTTV
jgi:2-dehydro-3-deoxyglucarate aldolase